MRSEMLLSKCAAILLISPSHHLLHPWSLVIKSLSVFHFRQQVTEIIFVLKAISTLMDSLKKTQPENGEYQTVERWNRTVKKEMTWEILVLCLPAAHSVKCFRAQLVFLNNWFPDWELFFPARSTRYYNHYRCNVWKSGFQINFLQDVWITEIVSMHKWEFYQGEKDFSDCLLQQFILFSFSPSPLPLLFCHSFVFRLQWMTTRGLRWSACTPRWWSASRAPHLRWARL